MIAPTSAIGIHIAAKWKSRNRRNGSSIRHRRRRAPDAIRFLLDVVSGPHKETGFETEIQIEPGASYYFELGPVVRLNIDLFAQDSMGVTGRPMPGRFGAGTYFMFYSLDAAAGAASVARLKS